MNLAAPANYSVTIKENEKLNNYLDFARELRILRDMGAIPIVVDALRTVSNVLGEGLEDVETIPSR